MTRQDEIAAKAVRISTLKSLKQKRALRIRQIKEEAANKIREYCMFNSLILLAASSLICLIRSAYFDT